MRFSVSIEIGLQFIIGGRMPVVVVIRFGGEDGEVR